MPARGRQSGTTWADLNFDRNEFDKRYPSAEPKMPAERGARPRTYHIPQQRPSGVSSTRYPIDRRVQRAAVATAEQVEREERVAKGLVPQVRRATKDLEIPRFGGPGLRRGILGPVSNALDLIDLVDNLARPSGPNWPGPRHRPYVQLRCLAVPYTSPPKYPVTDWQGTLDGHVIDNLCGLDGQAWSFDERVPYPAAYGYYPGGEITDTLVGLQNETDGVNRVRISEVWWRHIPANTPIEAGTDFVPSPMTLPMDPASRATDPNDDRRQPGDDPVPEAGQPHPSAGQSPDPATSVDLSLGSSPWAFSDNGPVPPRGRQPVKTNEREAAKQGSLSQRFSRAVFNALDAVSEWGEVINCVYASLPKATRKRWEKDRGLHWVKVKTMYHPEGQWIKTKARKGLSVWETAGQYGIDGADWKSEAIWHNSHLIDGDSAFKCIVLNHLEDKFYGAIHRRLPKNTGNALDQSQQAVAEFINAVEEAFGL